MDAHSRGMGGGRKGGVRREMVGEESLNRNRWRRWGHGERGKFELEGSEGDGIRGEPNMPSLH